jgi:hypothetical protein
MYSSMMTYSFEMSLVLVVTSHLLLYYFSYITQTHQFRQAACKSVVCITSAYRLMLIQIIQAVKYITEVPWQDFRSHSLVFYFLEDSS